MNNFYFFLNMLSILVLIIILVISYKNKNVKGGLPFTFGLASLLIWTIGSVVELSVTTFSAKVFWRNFTQIGVFFIPICVLWFVVEYSKDESKNYKGLIVLSAIIGLISIILIFTNPFHHLMRKSVVLELVDSKNYIVVKQTLLGEIMVFYSFALVIFAFLKLGVFYIKARKKMKLQVLMILMGGLIPFIFSLLSKYWLNCIHIHIPISTSFLIGASFIALSIFRYEFLSISPIAKDWVIDAISEGIVVCSPDKRVIDVNKAALEFFNCHLDINKKSTLPGKYNFNDYNSIIHNCYNEWSVALEGSKDKSFRIKMESESCKRHFNIKIHILEQSPNRKLCSISVITDITEEINKTKYLKRIAEIDNLTETLNRGAFIRKVDNCKSVIVSFLILDIDYFKNINDTYGHIVGDEVIKAITKVVKNSIRKEDIVGRIGGDEFGVLLLDCDKKLCNIISERILKAVNQYSLNTEKENIKVSLSIGGIYESDTSKINFMYLFEKADKALYEAKNLGRNRAVIS